MKRVLPALSLLLVLAACRQAPAPEPEPAAPAEAAPAPVAGAPPAEAAPAAGQVPRAFLCRGNEPFWALDIGAGSALLKTPDGETALDGELRATDGGAFTFRGAPEDEPAERVGVVISPGQCFDTMADGPASPFSAIASFADGHEGNGCCTAEYGLDLDAAPAFDPAATDPDTWTRLLPELSEAIARCAADAGVATEAVTKAWPTNRGKAVVRLRDSSQARFDCLIDLEMGDIETVTAVAAGDLVPHEGQPLWLPAREEPPVLHCGRVERVLDVGDVVVAYLHYTDGC